MKRFLYSKYTKFAAAVIFVACIVLGALTATTGINNLMQNERDMIYQFESDFSDSKHLINLLYEPENVIFNAYRNLYETSVSDNADDIVTPNENNTIVPNEDNTVVMDTTSHSMSYYHIDSAVKTNITPNKETIEKNIEKRLQDLYCNDKIDYYIKWNDRVFTNCDATSPQELAVNDFYIYTMRPGKGDNHVERVANYTNNIYSSYMLEEIVRFDNQDSIEIAATINEGYLNKCDEDWYRQEGLINDLIYRTLVFAIIALLMFIYLLCVCGKNKDGEIVPMWIDNIWLEVHLAAIGIIGFFALYIIVVLMDEVFTGHFPERLFNIIEIFTTAIAGSAILTSFLSIIRNIKRRNFISSSVIMRFIRWCWKIFVKVLVWLRNAFVGYRKLLFKTLSKKTGVLLIGTLFGYTALIGLFGVFTLEAGNPFWILIGIALFVGASFLVAHRAKDIDEIKKGVSEIRNYNSAYKIPELKCEDLRELANNINDIGNSIDESVSAKMKAERMKTELITNVSHDLKTPLTSIISYTELLSKVDGLPEEAMDYVQVIAKKSDRLKTLTQDLFDISKAQSGNEEIFFEKLDAELLINQSIAEFDKEIEGSEIKFCVDADKELYFPADSRKMSRVVNNLIGNILKYSMRNTRAFISAKEKDGQIILEFKNTSAYPLDFDAEEIMGRFVRGDESRTTEGNGLGLAIAKSYTELCNGTLDIVLDGDLFKAIIKFRKF